MKEIGAVCNNCWSFQAHDINLSEVLATEQYKVVITDECDNCKEGE